MLIFKDAYLLLIFKEIAEI